MVHHILKGGRGVAKTKIHDHWFIEAILCLERCFVLVPIFDAYFVKASFLVFESPVTRLEKDRDRTGP